jgi:hypothetical protein
MQEIDKMMVAGLDKKTDIVQLSIESGVLCPYTALFTCAKIMQG